MEEFKENSWYIRGCAELADYFDKNDIGLCGDYDDIGYYIEDGKWECSNIEYLQDRIKITLQDYLDSLKITYKENAQTETPEKERFQKDGSLYIGEGLENYYIDQLTRTKKYFVFPKAEEGDFPDLSNWEGVKMEMSSDVKGKKGWINCKVFYKFPKTLNNHYIFCCYPHNSMDVRPIQKQKLTLAELAEKAGLDINNIEIIE